VTGWWGLLGIKTIFFSIFGPLFGFLEILIAGFKPAVMTAIIVEYSPPRPKTGGDGGLQTGCDMFSRNKITKCT
jgi:hypothetical protein